MQANASIHLQKKPKHSKETKVQESDPMNKRRQKWNQPVKNKTKTENKTKAESNRGIKQRKQSKQSKMLKKNRKARLK